MSRLTNKYLLICSNIIWVTIIFILCTMPSEDIPKSEFDIPYLDKIVHFGLFFILSSLLLVTNRLYCIFTIKQSYFVVILISFGFGGAIEILQHEFFNRGCEFGDLIADTMGGGVACLFFPLVKRFLKIWRLF